MLNINIHITFFITYVYIINITVSSDTPSISLSNYLIHIGDLDIPIYSPDTCHSLNHSKDNGDQDMEWNSLNRSIQPQNNLSI